MATDEPETESTHTHSFATDALSAEQVASARDVARESLASARKAGRWLAGICGVISVPLGYATFLEISRHASHGLSGALPALTFFMLLGFVGGLVMLSNVRAGARLTETGEPTLYDAEAQAVRGYMRVQKTMLMLIDRSSHDIVGVMSVEPRRAWLDSTLSEPILVWGTPLRHRPLVAVNRAAHLGACGRLQTNVRGMQRTTR
jgi:hypothetical protein